MTAEVTAISVTIEKPMLRRNFPLTHSQSITWKDSAYKEQKCVHDELLR